MYFKQERVKRILEELKKYIYPESEAITKVLMKKGDFTGPAQADENKDEWILFNTENDRWGGKDQRYWFRLEFAIPPRFNGKTIVFEIKYNKEGQWNTSNPQFLIYLDGKVVQGLDLNHQEIVINEDAKAGAKYIIDLHAFGNRESKVEFKPQIAVLDRITEKIYYDIKVPLEVVMLLNKEDKRKIDTVNFLNDAVNLLDLRKPHSREYYDSLKAADEYLQDKLYGKSGETGDISAACIGHTHLDVAWLWPLKQTREKAAHSFSTVLNMMKEYPEYLFMSSQPQLYKFIKEEHPEIYQEIKERVKEGRWEAEGGMWLEADCNLASGESLIRQFLFGTRFFKEEFGVDNKILWLPDVFGYSAALPQILNRFGIKYFVTTKISWNEYNKVPYDTFLWEGLDGSEVFTYFVSATDYEKVLAGDHRTTYNAVLKPSQVMGAWLRYQQKDINNEVLISYGYGDGGGGPTKEMLENARRMKNGLPGCPGVKMSKARDFLERLEKRVLNSEKLPKWVGELYLEYHRGTYTSMARNKRYNRKSEFLFQDVELFNMLNKYLNDTATYPGEMINNCWEIILLNQFHDILPGSSIKEVYDESWEQYEKIFKDGVHLLQKAINEIASHIKLAEKTLVVFNQLSFERNDIIIFEITEKTTNIELVDREGAIYPVQAIGDNKAITYVKNIPAKGYKTFAIRQSKNTTTAPLPDTLRTDAPVISNKFFDITFDQNANITSIYDKVCGREILKPNARANVLQVFEDKPYNYDAWDINIYYQEKMWEINDVTEIKALASGQVRTTIAIKKKFLDSEILQLLHVYNDIPRIDFENVIDWKEKQLLLKAAFPVDVHAVKATYEVQYGNIERPTHWNTSWDTAKFEVCAHKWADLSEEDYGVSLLNDCKYGYDIKDGIMRLTLLKSAAYPNPDADREIHRFTYSLYPHRGDFRRGQTIQMAYTLNCPMYGKVEEPHDGALPGECCFVKSNQENAIIEVVKKAEDSEDAIIRVYECFNRRNKVILNFFKELKYVAETDLNEGEIAVVNFEGTSFSFEIKPYEIRTFKVKL